MSTPPDREFRPHPRPALIGNEGEGCLLCLKAANVVLELRASEAMFLEAHSLAPHGLPLVSRKHIARARAFYPPLEARGRVRTGNRRSLGWSRGLLGLALFAGGTKESEACGQVEVQARVEVGEVHKSRRLAAADVHWAAGEGGEVELDGAEPRIAA